MRVRLWSSPGAELGATSTRLWHSRTSSYGNVRTCGRFSSVHVEGSRLGCSPSGRWTITSFPSEGSTAGNGGRISEFPSLSCPRSWPRSEFTVESVRSWSW